MMIVAKPRTMIFAKVSNHNFYSSHLAPSPTTSRQKIWAPKPVLLGTYTFHLKTKNQKPTERHLAADPEVGLKFTHYHQ